MKCTTENIEKVFRTLLAQHVDNTGASADFGQFDDESDLVSAVKNVIDQLEDDREYACVNCGGGFKRHEMSIAGEDHDENEYEEDFCLQCFPGEIKEDE